MNSQRFADDNDLDDHEGGDSSRNRNASRDRNLNVNFISENTIDIPPSENTDQLQLQNNLQKKTSQRQGNAMDVDIEGNN